MLIELYKVPGTFQRIMDLILIVAKWHFAFVYSGKIVIFRKQTKKKKKRTEHVCKVLYQLHSAGATLKLKKCKFFTDPIDCLDDVAYPQQLRLASNTADAIRGLQTPTNLTYLRTFLGYCSFIQLIAPNFARIAALHSRLLRNDSP